MTSISKRKYNQALATYLKHPQSDTLRELYLKTLHTCPVALQPSCVPLSEVRLSLVPSIDIIHNNITKDRSANMQSDRTVLAYSHCSSCHWYRVESLYFHDASDQRSENEWEYQISGHFKGIAATVMLARRDQSCARVALRGKTIHARGSWTSRERTRA